MALLLFLFAILIGGCRSSIEDSSQPEEIVARANGSPISRAEFERNFDETMMLIISAYASTGQVIRLENLWRYRMDAIDSAVGHHVLMVDSKRRGISVTNRELESRADKLVDEEIARLRRKVTSDADLERLLAQIVAETKGDETADAPLPEAEFRRWLRSRFLNPRAGTEEAITLEKVRRAVTDEVAVTEDDLLKSFDVATVREIVVEVVTDEAEPRTREEALRRAEELRARILSGEEFSEVARTESDARATARAGGLIGHVPRGRGLPEWEDVVFALKPGELSEIIELPWGYSIVQMVERRHAIPPDYETQKETLRQKLEGRKKAEVWSSYRRDLWAKVDLEILDLELRAYELLRQDSAQEAVALLQQAAPDARRRGGLAAVALLFKLATMLGEQGQWQAVAITYEDCAELLSSGELGSLRGGHPQALMGIGIARENLGDIERAEECYRAASESTNVRFIHDRVRMAARRIQSDDLLEREKSWLKAQKERERRSEEARNREVKPQQREIE